MLLQITFGHWNLKADFQSSHEAPRSSLRVHAWALSSNHNAKQLILIIYKHSQRVARSFVRGLEIRLKGPFIFYQEGGGGAGGFFRGATRKNSDVKGGSPQEN